MPRRSGDPAVRIKQARRAIEKRKAEMLRPKNPAAVIMSRAGVAARRNKKEHPDG
jgi:hypothetical protein